MDGFQVSLHSLASQVAWVLSEYEVILCILSRPLCYAFEWDVCFFTYPFQFLLCQPHTFHSQSLNYLVRRFLLFPALLSSSPIHVLWLSFLSVFTLQVCFLDVRCNRWFAAYAVWPSVRHLSDFPEQKFASNYLIHLHFSPGSLQFQWIYCLHHMFFRDCMKGLCWRQDTRKNIRIDFI